MEADPLIQMMSCGRLSYFQAHHMHVALQISTYWDASSYCDLYDSLSGMHNLSHAAETYACLSYDTLLGEDSRTTIRKLRCSQPPSCTREPAQKSYKIAGSLM